MTSTPPIESVARVATTPEQAKVFVAMLQAEGIPARIDGDTLTDEFAASRRLMNLLGTKIFVPTASLARAQEILQPVAIDPAEIEREALAARGEAAPPTRAATPSERDEANRSSLAGPLLVLAIGAAALFAYLWHGARTQRDMLAAAAASNPVFDYVPDGTSLKEVRRRDGRTLRVMHDPDRNGVHETYDVVDANGRVLATVDQFVDGIWCRITEKRTDTATATWVDVDRDGVVDRGTVTDRDGKVVQTIEWETGRGFVVKTP